MKEHEVNKVDDLHLHLSQMEKMAAIGQLTSSVAHEMRNLLGMIRTAAFNIDRSLIHADRSVKNNLDVIGRSVSRAREFIDNLLNLSRISGNEEVVDISKLIDRLLLLFSKEMEWKGITLVREYENLPLFQLDCNALQECLVNLILNAIQSIEGGGVITVKVKSWELGVQITVSDTGCGISQGDLEKIFDRFYTTKTSGQGTGLGLTIVKSITQSLGGMIKVTSIHGKGSTFTLEIPNLKVPITVIEPHQENTAGNSNGIYHK